MLKRSPLSISRIALFAVVSAIAGSVAAQDTRPTYTTFGTVGLLEMPTAESAPVGELAGTLAYSNQSFTNEPGYRSTLTFQLLDRLSGSFRYAIFDIYDRDTTETFDDITRTYDRSFDIQYRLLNESRYLPTVAVGLRDFLGTGRYSSEYFVATKTFADSFKVTGGLGFGRMGQRNGVDNPLGGSFDTRNEPNVFDRDAGVNTGGQLSVKQWFRGDMAPFGGIEYVYSPNLSFKAEYSSIEYPRRIANPAQEVDSPLNFGVTYRPRPGVELAADYLYGNELGLRATFDVNPNDRPTFSGFDQAPAPVKPRTAEQMEAARSWNRAAEPQLRSTLADLLEVEGIDLLGLEMTDRRARVRYQNNRYRSETQAAGRVSRMMTQVMPPAIETFVLEPERNGLPLSAINVPRSALEQLENTVGSTDAIFEAISVAPAGSSTGLTPVDDPEPRFRYGIGPYADFTFFTPGKPVDPDVGLRFRAEYDFTRNFSIAGSASISALGARDPLTAFRDDNSYVNVRTDRPYFGLDGGVQLDRLYLSYADQLAPEVYGRIVGGYLEQMYGGVSTEVLYAPVDKKWALGAEVAYAALRDQDMNFDFALYETQPDGERVEVGDYDVVTGFVSGYYDFDNGFVGRIDVGRYLAGDVGATFALSREFENGWEIGGFFSLTDMPFSEFGEGSFDKGITISIPSDFFTGQPSRTSISTGLRSLTRDGGARLSVPGSLYGTVHPGQRPELLETKGRFWR
ncbi:YjbH domain-containing protein [Salipiger sp. IMCC34102]|uniref:YjbH domain-containing protein n=1 Tax=Salipiger sp. IMCC34102 TaxID=2510647 RepID=UPI00101D5595|nr:YjbH domain-containing protein [Salipiger sp. IMCC34102]RYH04027.1 YjbH domain-containing protein [Salipiger sp. IMCC34102]